MPKVGQEPFDAEKYHKTEPHKIQHQKGGMPLKTGGIEMTPIAKTHAAGETVKTEKSPGKLPVVKSASKSKLQTVGEDISKKAHEFVEKVKSSIERHRRPIYLDQKDGKEALIKEEKTTMPKKEKEFTGFNPNKTFGRQLGELRDKFKPTTGKYKDHGVPPLKAKQGSPEEMRDRYPGKTTKQEREPLLERVKEQPLKKSDDLQNL
jgi:hypothetical protein